jgi:hypothetical protein
MLAAEPIESSEATEPTEPIDKIDPLEPMLRMDPDEPIERGAPALLRMGSFSQPGRSSGPQGPTGGDAHPDSRLVTAANRQVAAKCSFRTSRSATELPLEPSTPTTMRGGSSSGLLFIESSW